MRRILVVVAVWLAVCPAIVARAADEAVSAQEQWICVTAPEFREEVQPLLSYREAQGMTAVLVDAGEVLGDEGPKAGRAEALRDRVHELCRAWEGDSYVLLVGAPEGEGRNVVPALRGKAGAMRGWPTDNWYGHPNKGIRATVAVGRLPARTGAEARDMVAKILAWESDTRPGEWKRRITVLAGAPSYTPAVDALIESVAFSELQRLSPEWRGRAIYDNPNSPFALPGGRVREQALAYMREGQLLTVYVGHSSAGGFSGIGRTDWADLSIERGAGVFATFGCYGCKLGGGDGYGVHAMRSPRGPVAVIGAHGFSWPTMGALLARGMLSGLADGSPPARLGDLWLDMKRELAEGRISPVYVRISEHVAGGKKVSPIVQRLEHMEMYMLLGDPATQLPAIRPRVRLSVRGELKPGGTLAVEGEVDPGLHGASGRVMLERTVTSRAAGLAELPEGGGEARRRVMEENHRRANRFVLAEREVKADAGAFRVELNAPDPLPWRELIVRAYLATETDEGMGVATVELEPEAQE